MNVFSGNLGLLFLKEYFSIAHCLPLEQKLPFSAEWWNSVFFSWKIHVTISY